MLDLKYSTILKVAVPLMISSFIQSIVLITDSSFLSRYSTDAFAAVGNGGLIYITLYMAYVGMSDGAQILIARRIGQQNTGAIGRIFGTSIITNLILAVVLYLIISLIMPDLLRMYSKHADLATQQIKYINIRGYALFFAMISLSIQAFFMAHGKTMVVLISAGLTAISNIILDYGLIFGKLGLPQLGLKGAAWASTIADGTGMIFLILALLLSVENKKYKLIKHIEFSTDSMKELFKIGSPLMLQGFAALATWTVFFTWLEQIGKFELTVSQNIRSIYFLAFVPIWGFAGTTKTYISQYIGAQRFDDLPKIQRRIQLMTILFLFVFFHGAIFYPDKMISLINPEVEFISKSSDILRFISVSIFMYGIFSVYFQTINGSGNTRISFYIEMASVFTYLTGSFLLIKVLKADIFWIWSVEYIYFATTGILAIIYLRTSNWKNKII
ncbi:MAG: MATE family efflux transporter [Bacteroidetes bacterium]|nr:MAG: MATE family efflux transporter [Bacteroidota bacterium]